MKTRSKHRRAFRAATMLAAAGLATGIGDAAESPVAPPATAQAAISVRGAVITTGFANGAYTTLVQIAVDGAPLGAATWRLVAEHLGPGGNKEQWSERIEVAEPKRGAVFEVEVPLAPGRHTLALEAEESTGGQKAEGRVEWTLPDPADRIASVSPIAVVQPVAAAFSRNGEVRARGALARVRGEPVLAELHAALVSVVCRSRAIRTAVEVHRKLEGGAGMRFAPVILQPDDEPCAQIRDLVPPGAMKAGAFRYQVHVVNGGTQLTAEFVEFSVVEAGATAGPGGRE